MNLSMMNFSHAPSADFRVVEDVKRARYEPRGGIIMFRMFGSVWPRVLPYCFANLLIMGLILYLGSIGIDVTVAPTGLGLTATLISFLIVSRTQAVYNRFFKTAEIITSMNQDLREFFSWLIVLSAHDKSEAAQKWRFDIAYDLIILLRTTITALEFRSSQISTWDVLPEEISSKVKAIEGNNFRGRSAVEKCNSRWHHGGRTLTEENFRTPILLSYYIRDTIISQRERLEQKLSGLEEMKLLAFISNFMTGFHQLRAFVATPFPFPLVQMARTFLFFWVYALPLALCHELEDPFFIALVLFIATYGYIGLEFVSIELSDPYGDDPNDFDELNFAQMVFEDVYITLSKVDGPENAKKLREKVKIIASKLEYESDGNKLDRRVKSETTPLVGN